MFVSFHIFGTHENCASMKCFHAAWGQSTMTPALLHLIDLEQFDESFADLVRILSYAKLEDSEIL